MFRLAVALYLMIVTAVAPAACCCTFTRLAPRPAEGPTAPPSAPACCCEHDHESRPPAEPPCRPSPPSVPSSPDCPCKQAVQDALTLPADEAQVLSLRIAAGEFVCPALVHWAVPVTATATPALRESDAPGPSFSTDDLLYACHVLRC